MLRGVFVYTIIVGESEVLESGWGQQERRLLKVLIILAVINFYIHSVVVALRKEATLSCST